jgi:hypothetical protein|eukprot:COSAG01_NODE_5250_length_4384_cov_82.995566_3_plen_104_part_00
MYAVSSENPTRRPSAKLGSLMAGNTYSRHNLCSTHERAKPLALASMRQVTASVNTIRRQPTRGSVQCSAVQCRANAVPFYVAVLGKRCGVLTYNLDPKTSLFS